MKRKQESQNAKIVLTGGHAGATAYAVIEELRRRTKSLRVYWIGPSKALEGRFVPTFEHEVFPAIGVNFYPIISGRIQTKFSLMTIPSLMKIPVGFLHAFFLLLTIRPEIVLSFGGYSAYPVVVISWLLGIPVVIHEQTMVAGRANISSSFFAKKIALARNESKKYFPKEKCVLVGNPVSDEIKKIEPKTNINEKPTLLITGGSRGAVKINDLVDQILEELLVDFKVIHQTGFKQKNKFLKKREKFSLALKKNYKVYGFIKPWEWFKYIKKADIIVSRSGANIVSEIIVSKRPSILIPLPIAHRNEQRENAEFAKKFAIATILDQGQINSSKLLKEIYKVRKNWKKITKKAIGKKSPDIDAASNLVNLLEGEFK